MERNEAAIILRTWRKCKKRKDITACPFQDSDEGCNSGWCWSEDDVDKAVECAIAVLVEVCDEAE